MKTTVTNAVVAALGLTIAACNSISYTPYTFEQLRAADYTLPANIHKIVVSSCTLPIVDDSTYYTTDTAYINARMKYAMHMPALVCSVLADKLNKSGYISAEIESDHASLSSILSNADSICAKHKADAMLVVTNCTYFGSVKMSMEDEIIMVSAMQTDLKFITPQGITRPFETQHDTLTWLLNSSDKFPPYREIYYSISEQTGQHIAMQIIPSWETRKRAIVGTSARALTDAANWAQTDEWDKAKDIWADIAQNGTGTDKVCATIDLGLYYERADNVLESAMWFSKALDLIEQEQKNTTIQNMKRPVEMLFQRSIDRQYEKLLLDKQMNN